MSISTDCYHHGNLCVSKGGDKDIKKTNKQWKNHLVKVGTETDQVEDGGRDKDVEEDTKKFSTKSDRHSDRLDLLELHHLVANSMLAKEMALPQFWFPVYHTSSALEVHHTSESHYSFA